MQHKCQNCRHTQTHTYCMLMVFFHHGTLCACVCVFECMDACVCVWVPVSLLYWTVSAMTWTQGMCTTAHFFLLLLLLFFACSCTAFHISVLNFLCLSIACLDWPFHIAVQIQTLKFGTNMKFFVVSICDVGMNSIFTFHPYIYIQIHARCY